MESYAVPCPALLGSPFSHRTCLNSFGLLIISWPSQIISVSNGIPLSSSTTTRHHSTQHRRPIHVIVLLLPVLPRVLPFVDDLLLQNNAVHTRFQQRTHGRGLAFQKPQAVERQRCGRPCEIGEGGGQLSGKVNNARRDGTKPLAIGSWLRAGMGMYLVDVVE